MTKYIAYYRVSTREQGDSGLGLDAQKAAVTKFVEDQGATLLQSYVEIESGTKKDRKILKEAIQQCHNLNAVLVVKKLDRLSRGGLGIIIEMEERGVRFVESDSPNDNDLIRDIKLSFAKEEAKAISDRTKSALGVIKEKNRLGIEHVSKAGNIVKSLGNPQNLTRKAIDNSIAVRVKAAKEHPDNVRAGAMVVALAEAGNNLSQITKKLNNAGFRTSRGGEFSQVQTKRIYERYKNNL